MKNTIFRTVVISQEGGKEGSVVEEEHGTF